MLGEVFKYISKDGKEVVCDVLYTFDFEGKDYIVYTDGSRSKNGSLKAYANRYFPDDLSRGFEAIESERAFKRAKDILSIIQDEVEEHLKRRKGAKDNVVEESV